MLDILLYIALALGILNVISGLIVTAKDLFSRIFFKVVPFFLGLGTILYFLLAKGLI